MSKDSDSLGDSYSSNRRTSNSNKHSSSSRLSSLNVSKGPIAFTALAAVVLALILMIVGATGPFGQNPAASPSHDDYENVYSDVEPSMVTVYSTSNQSGQLVGSGYIYTDDNYIITNAHVVSSRTTHQVRFHNGEWSNATLVGKDLYTDIAVLKVESTPSSAQPIEFETTLPNHGTRVAALGSPSNLRGSISSGIVSGVERQSPSGTGFPIPDMIQTDAPLNPGNSGGPLVNMDGDVVGMNTARQGEDGIGFAISARLTQTIADSLIEDGQHRHSLIGVTVSEMNPEIARANNVSDPQGLLVNRVFEGGPSEGVLQPSDRTKKISGNVSTPVGGDIIVAIEGEKVDTTEDIGRYLILHTTPGEEVELTILRDGEKQTVTLTLGARAPVQSTPNR